MKFEMSFPHKMGLHVHEVLQENATEQKKRLVLFASQRVLEAVAMAIGADFNGKAGRTANLCYCIAFLQSWLCLVAACCSTGTLEIFNDLPWR